MAITNSIGAFYRPFAGKYSDYQPPKIDLLQTTTGAVVATTTVRLISTATVADTIILYSINGTISNPTAAAILTMNINGPNVIGTYATGGSANINFNFGPFGLLCGSAASATAWVSMAGATSTVNMTCVFGKVL